MQSNFACLQPSPSPVDDYEEPCPTVGGESTRSPPVSILLRSVMQVSRARWFGFLRRVFQYQNGTRSDQGRSPFDSGPWMAMEFAVLVIQIVGITATLALANKERPWPLRIWICGYNLGNILSLPHLYWRYRCSRRSQGGVDLEEQGAHEESRSSDLVNKCKGLLELFFVLWFIVGNVWVFDARYGSLEKLAPTLHTLCVVILVWNALVYSFPFVLFLFLCCCVPLISTILGYNMNSGSVSRGALDDQIEVLRHWKFKEADRESGFSNSDSAACCICLSSYRDEEEVRQLPCSHLFHMNCVDQWLRIISCCPLCKHQLYHR